MKALSQRSLPELKQVFEEFNIPLPADPTKKELLADLKQYGIDNKKIKAFEDKKENKLEINESDAKDQPAVEGDVVVAMTRKNPEFGWRTYKFSRTRPFAPMSKDEAIELIQEYDGFHIATREEIKRYYK